MCTLCLREKKKKKKKTKPICRHFPESNSTVEWKVNTSTVQAARLANGETGRSWHLRLLRPLLCQHPSATWSRKQEGKRASTSTVLALHQLALGSQLVIPIACPPRPFAHPTGKPRFLLNIPGREGYHSKLSWPPYPEAPHQGSASQVSAPSGRGVNNTGRLLSFILTQPQTYLMVKRPPASTVSHTMVLEQFNK